MDLKNCGILEIIIFNSILNAQSSFDNNSVEGVEDKKSLTQNRCRIERIANVCSKSIRVLVSV